MNKQSRYWGLSPVVGWTYAVYDHPNPNKATFTSLVNDLNYYRSNFKLRKVWTEEEIFKNTCNL